MSNTTYKIVLTQELNCAPEDAFRIVERIEHFPDFMPNVHSISIIEADERRKVAEWNIVIDEAPLDWIEEGIYDRDSFIVNFRVIEGIFDRFDGYWKVIPEHQGCKVIFELCYEVGLPEIEDIIGSTLQERMIENARSMLSAIEERTGI